MLEPLDFWSYVPAVWNSRYHFYNAPISKDIAAPMSPLRTIKQIARKSDFVAFKLDVDTPETEIPIALEIRDNPEYSAYIDEFFFELHFNCEIVGENAWGYGKGLVNGPPDVKGLKMNRKGALELFRDYRIAGIRAHFWP